MTIAITPKTAKAIPMQPIILVINLIYQN